MIHGSAACNINMLYSTYRPQTLAEVEGQESNLVTLREQIIQKKYDSAYLFAGHRGTGKQLSPVFLNALYAAKILHRTGRAINVETVWRF